MNIEPIFLAPFAVRATEYVVLVGESYSSAPMASIFSVVRYNAPHFIPPSFLPTERPQKPFLVA
jgi:hypothetical protein